MQNLNRTLNMNHFVSHFTMTRNILAGAGMAWAVKKENYSHIPLIFLFPSMYVGYHAFNNKEELIKYVKGELYTTK